MQPEFAPHARALHRTVLVLFEEPTIRELLALSFRQAGYFPVSAATAQEGWRLTREVRPDVVLIDMDSPATADPSLAHALRTATGTAPLTVMMTADVPGACGEHASRCGASLCVAKPFHPRELVGRVTRELRGQSAPAATREPAPSLCSRPIEIDPRRNKVRVRLGGRIRSLELPPVEMKLLRCLLDNPGQVRTREQILAAVWGEESLIEPRSVDQTVKRLRQGLNAADAGGMVRTVRGQGYCVDLEP